MNFTKTIVNAIKHWTENKFTKLGTDITSINNDISDINDNLASLETGLSQKQPAGDYALNSDLGKLATQDIVLKSNLESSVQASLNKADTALQSFAETDPTVPAWAKAASKPTYTASEVGADEEGSAVQALADAKSYTDTKVADLVNSAPETLDTLGELATALQENEDVTEALNAAIGNKANKSDLTAHIEDKENPHNVTAEQVAAVSYDEQVLTEEQKVQARENIGAGTSSFGGSWYDLVNVPFGDEIVYNLSETTVALNENNTTVGAGNFAMLAESVAIPLVADQDYILTLDGVRFECKSKALPYNGMTAIVLGDEEYFSTGLCTAYPFCFGYITGMGAIAVPNAETSSITLSIAHPKVAKKLDSKYLDLVWIPEYTYEYKEIIPETEVADGDNGIGFVRSEMNELGYDPTSFIPGKTGVVYIDGVKYTDTIKLVENSVDGNFYYMGNLALVNESNTNTGENYFVFAYASYNMLTIMASASIKTVALSVLSDEPIASKLPEDMLPDCVAKEEDLNGLATEGYVDEKIAEIEIPSVEGLASETYVDEKIAEIEVPSIDGLASETYVEQKISEIEIPVASVNGKTGAVNLTASDVEALPSTTAIPSNLVNGRADGSLRTTYANSNIGISAFAEGRFTFAPGKSSHAEGNGTIAFGMTSHAEGSMVVAFGDGSHAEGSCMSLSLYVSGEGNATQYTSSQYLLNEYIGRIIMLDENGNCAKIIAIDETGYTITVSQTLSAESISSAQAIIPYSAAIGDSSHIEGYSTIARSNYQHVQGIFNTEDVSDKYAHIVGNGSNFNSRSNAHTLDWDGVGWFQGGVKIGGTGQDDAAAQTLATEEYVKAYVEEAILGGEW